MVQCDHERSIPDAQQRGGDRSRGSAPLHWLLPLTGALHGYLQLFSGYGESLIDYNQSQTGVGVGVTIAGWR